MNDKVHIFSSCNTKIYHSKESATRRCDIFCNGGHTLANRGPPRWELLDGYSLLDDGSFLTIPSLVIGTDFILLAAVLRTKRKDKIQDLMSQYNIPQVLADGSVLIGKEKFVRTKE